MTFIEVLQEFAQWPRVPEGLRITNRRRDNETTSEFRRERRAAGVPCACGGRIVPPAHGGPAAQTCIDCKRRARALRDKGRKR